MRTSKPLAKVLPPAEWDFRQIDDLALAHATIYEYARSSKKLRPSISELLQTKIDGHRICEYNLAALQFRHNKTRPDWWNPEDPKLKAIYSKIYGLQCRTIKDDRLFSVIRRRPDFPAPWTALPVTYSRNPRFSTIHVTPMWLEVDEIRDAIESGDSWEAVAGRLQRLEHYELSIMWGDVSSVDQLVEDFARWARRESQRHQRSRGLPSQAPIAPLKWLAAYRLSESGLTYPQAQALLESYADPANDTLARLARNAGVEPVPRALKVTERGKRSALPIFNDKSGWSDAIRRAKLELARLESVAP